MVRAKFVLNSYETHMTTDYDKKNADGTYGKVESRTLKFSVVTSGSEENKRFFASTPTGTLELKTVSPEAWSKFELNKEYYVDFTQADL